MHAGQVVALVVMWVIVGALVLGVLGAIAYFVYDHFIGAKQPAGDRTQFDFVQTGTDPDALLGLQNHGAGINPR
jgi:hypothetical protein